MNTNELLPFGNISVTEGVYLTTSESHWSAAEVSITKELDTQMEV